MGVVNKISAFKSLLTSPSNVLTYYLKETFLPEFSLKAKVMESNPGYFSNLFYFKKGFGPIVELLVIYADKKTPTSD